MITTINLVKCFMQATGQATPEKPNLGELPLRQFRVNLIREELNELENALWDNNPVATLDALTDIQYVLDGTFVAFGLERLKDESFLLVHWANMQKIHPDGTVKRYPNGKIIKPAGWKHPDLSVLFHRYED